MPRPPKKKTLGRTEAAVFVLCLLVGLGVLRYLGEDAMTFSYEAHIRAGVGQDLLYGASRGRQGLVGSLYYAPLPTLLALPLLKLPPPFGGPYALVLVSLACGAFMAACLSAWLRTCGITPFSRLGIALAVFASPLFLPTMIHGSSEPLFALCLLAASCLLMHWWQSDALRSLAYLAIVVALSLTVRSQGVALLALVSVFVVIRLIQRRHSESYAEATLIIFLTPVAYIAALWLVSNWLIMDAPLFFMRGLANTTDAPGHAASLLTDGCTWRPAGLLCLLALLGRAAASVKTPPLKRLAGLAVMLSCLMFWTSKGITLRRAPSPAEAELPRVLAEFHEAFGREWLLVSGYRGYDVARLMKGRHEGYLYHTLSFYPDMVLRDTRGKRAYLLVPLPEGADRWEDINLKYPRIADEPTSFTVYERTWPHWRLWRVVRMDTTDRK